MKVELFKVGYQLVGINFTVAEADSPAEDNMAVSLSICAFPHPSTATYIKPVVYGPVAFD